MRHLLIALLIFPFSASAQFSPSDISVDHAWIKGVYWNSSELPGWGFFVDVQEENMFGAIYGYLGSESTFVTLQGELVTLNPLVFQGEVYFVTEGGTSVSPVGDFTWSVRYQAGEPAANLDITSNILNMNNLRLVRLSYVEVDKVDVITGGKWNIVRRISNSTYGDFYSIEDTRVLENGNTYAGVIDIEDMDNVGAVGYESDQGVYALLIPYLDTTNAFYLFLTTNTDMYGRYWLLDEGESPAGSGSYFRGAVDNFQSSYSGGETLTANSTPEKLENGKDLNREAKELELTQYSNSREELQPMFPEKLIQSAYEKLLNESSFQRDSHK